MWSIHKLTFLSPRNNLNQLEKTPLFLGSPKPTKPSKHEKESEIQNALKERKAFIKT